MTTKAPDPAGFDWSAWWAEHLPEVTAALEAVFEAAYLAEAPGQFVQAHEFAANYARQHGGELLAQLTETTRREIGELIAAAIESGASLAELTSQISGAYSFSAVRAQVIAATETASAMGQGGMSAARAQEKTEKRWYSQGNDHVCDDCQSNADEGWIGINDAFSSGDETIPAHVGCHCNVGYRGEWAKAAPAAEPAPVLAEARCADCHKLLGKDISADAALYCPRCKAVADLAGVPAAPSLPAWKIDYDGWGRMRRVQLEESR